METCEVCGNPCSILLPLTCDLDVCQGCYRDWVFDDNEEYDYEHNCGWESDEPDEV